MRINVTMIVMFLTSFVLFRDPTGSAVDIIIYYLGKWILDEKLSFTESLLVTKTFSNGD